VAASIIYQTQSTPNGSTEKRARSTKPIRDSRRDESQCARDGWHDQIGKIGSIGSRVLGVATVLLSSETTGQVPAALTRERGANRSGIDGGNDAFWLDAGIRLGRYTPHRSSISVIVIIIGITGITIITGITLLTTQYGPVTPLPPAPRESKPSQEPRGPPQTCIVEETPHHSSPSQRRHRRGWYRTAQYSPVQSSTVQYLLFLSRIICTVQYSMSPTCHSGGVQGFNRRWPDVRCRCCSSGGKTSNSRGLSLGWFSCTVQY
jgi:hypothetical protein